MKKASRRALRIFGTGLLAALPLAATVLIFTAGARLLYDWVGPGSLIGDILVALGLGVTSSKVVSYLIGLSIVAVAIFALGLLVRSRMRGALAAGVNAIVKRIPVVRNVYELVRRFVDLLNRPEAAGLRSMSPVWLRFGGPGQAAVLGLLSTPEPVLVGGQPYLAVLVPTAPVPVGGALVYVPQAWVTPAPVGVEGVTSIYVSMGVTSAQHLGRAPGNS